MKSRVSPTHIKILIIGVVSFCLILVIMLFYENVNDPTHNKTNIKFSLCGITFLLIILIFDIKITARKMFFKVEMTDNGISERFIHTTQHLKWNEIKYIYIVGQPFTRNTWLCFSKVNLAEKDFLRILSSRKSIVFPLTMEAKKFVSERCGVKIVPHLRKH